MKKTIMILFLITILLSSTCFAIVDQFVSDFSTTSPLSMRNSRTNNASVFNTTWMNFNGSNYITVLDTDALGSDNLSTELTVVVWAKFNNTQALSTLLAKGMTAQGSPETKAEYWMGMEGSNLKLTVGNGTNKKNSGTAYGTPPIGNWLQLVGVFNSTNVRLSVNGTGKSSQSLGSDFTFFQDTGRDLSIGADLERLSDARFFFNGSIESVRIYNVSLRRRQITRLYNEHHLGNDYGRSVVALGYHRIRETKERFSVNISNFTRQMQWLSDNGFETITFKQLRDFADYGNFTMPEKPIIIEFDDMYIEAHTTAKPIMDSFGFFGVMSINTANVGAVDHMTWEQLALMRDDGWEMGAHSVTHANLTSLDAVSVWNEFNESKRNVEGNLSVEVIHFRFPFNENTPSLDTNCSTLFVFCDGRRDVDNLLSGKFYYYAKGNRTHESEDSYGSQINMVNTTTFKRFVEIVGYDYGLALRLDLNENNGSTLYDKSPVPNVINITVPMWENDGVIINLTKDFEYSTSTTTFTLLDPFYNRQFITLDYNFTERGRPLPLGENSPIAKIFITTIMGIFLALFVLAYFATPIIPNTNWSMEEWIRFFIIGIIVVALIGILLVAAFNV